MKHSIYAQMLYTWGETLKKMQITQIPQKGLYGGILCPSCSRVHGRTLDAVYPFLCLAHRTGDVSYVDAAMRVYQWAEHVSRPDGSWVGETNHGWKGITVFSVIQLAEALKFHGCVLDKKTQAAWQTRLRRGADYLKNELTMETGNINYPITASAAFALAGEVLGDESYTAKARQFAHNAMTYMTPNRLIFGEGSPQRGITPKGCRAVDLGYNVEESLTGLALYAYITGDMEIKEQVVASLKSHLEFMLPDGAWDNSWGTRNFKWTYWGSRTSDGCQTAYGLLWRDEPAFGHASLQNARLLRDSTHNGFLYGGPDYFDHGELPCVHHTLFHAKAFATALDYGVEEPSLAVPLPRETVYGVKRFPEIDTFLISVGGWRGTITGYDWEYAPQSHASGGALSLLWHNGWGPVVAASLTGYDLIEENNMQLPVRDDHQCLTPRLEWGGVYQSILDVGAVVTQRKAGEEESVFEVQGRLCSPEHRDPPHGPAPFSITYTFLQDTVTCSFTAARDGVKLVFPVLSHGATVEAAGPGTYRLHKNGHSIYLKSSSSLVQGQPVFNLVPGFTATPFTAELKANLPLAVSLRWEIL